MTVLGIETSCDETAAAVVTDGTLLLSNVVASSMAIHARYGGVIPEIAAREHLSAILPVIDQALDDAFPALRGRRQQQWRRIDAIGVTYGAGLGGSLLVGVLTARTLAIVYGKPLYALNHVEGHLYANFLTRAASYPGVSDYKLPAKTPEFPLVGLIVSGGHSQLVYFRDHFDYTLLGQTHDDAIGEAFDKVAKMLGLPYPGGPSVSRKALEGNPLAFALPKAKLSPRASTGVRRHPGSPASGSTPEEAAQSGRYDFSFSGLKTAVLRLCQQQIGEDHTFASSGLPERLSAAQKADIAASFQRVAIETVVDKTVLACREFNPRSVIIGGGVASSQELRRQMSQRLDMPTAYPDPRLCTDNGAMMATLGCYKAMLAQPAADPYSLDIYPGLSM